MNNLAFNQRKVRCGNPICKYYDVARTVSLPLIGGDIYIDAPILCACGQPPRPIEKGEVKYA